MASIIAEYQQIKTDIIECLMGLNRYDSKKLDYGNFLKELLNYLKEISVELPGHLKSG